jgi:phosphate transport system ATP-binding protein
MNDTTTPAPDEHTTEPAPLVAPGPTAAPAFAGVPASTAVMTEVLAAPAPATRVDWVPEPAAPFAGYVDPAVADNLAELDAREVSAWFGDRKVLDKVSITMKPGKITALIGPSGCGKSTFLRILNRMHEMIPGASLAGEVLLDGDDIYGSARRLTDARREIGMVFQKPNPFPAMSIYDNVVAGLRLTGRRAGRSEKDDLVESSLTKAGLWREVRDRLRQPGGGLSGGQQQRLCIARSIAIQPRVLLMDEPCSALDPTSTRVIEETMVDLAKEVTIVIVTHNMQQAQRVSDDCAFFLAAQNTPGGVVEQGPTATIFENPSDERTADYVNGRFG